MTRKKRAFKKKASVSHRSQANLRKENRENFGLATPVAEAYQIVHDSINILRSGEKQIYEPKELIRCFFLMYNYVPNEKDGTVNFEALNVGVFFPEQLDNLTGLLAGCKVRSKDRTEALDNAINEVRKYYPINRRSEKVKEEVAKSRTSKKKAVAKGRTSKKKVVAAKTVSKRGRKASPLVTFGGEIVDADSVKNKVLSEDGYVDWEAFGEKLRKGKVKPSKEIGFKDNKSNPLADIIKAIGGNRGRFVGAKNVVQFVVDNVGVSERVARNRLYTLINNGQLDVV